MSAHVTILIKKKDGLSDEEFHSYWSKTHPSTFLSVAIAKSNLTRYSQFHIDRSMTNGLKEMGVPVEEDYDGGARFWGEKLEDVLAIFQDEEYNRVVVPDEEKFLKRDEAKMMVGWEEVKWEGGAVVGSEGKK